MNKIFLLMRNDYMAYEFDDTSVIGAYTTRSIANKALKHYSSTTKSFGETKFYIKQIKIQGVQNGK